MAHIKLVDRVEPAPFRRALGNFCTGVVIITAWGKSGEPLGFTAQSLVSLSLEPPLVGVSPSKLSSTWPQIRAAGRFCVNILSESQAELSWRFARHASDRFGDLEWTEAAGGPLFAGVVGYLDCRLAAEHDAGDHTFAVGQVLDTKVAEPPLRPLLFFRGAHELLARSA